MADHRVHVHFWSPDPVPAGVDDWDPDAHPARHADGFGHNVLELYVRMRRAGCRVTVGPGAPPGARVVVFLPSLLERRAQLRLVRQLAPRRRVPVVAVRSDFVPDYRLPFQPSVEVMPNRSSVVAAHQTWLPPLPQRGLVRREPSRGDQVVTLTYKGYPENLPLAARASEWAGRVREAGMEWDADVRDPAGHNRWHDFSAADVALCLRADGPAVGLLRKPATKLVNAWVGGAIPLVGREPAYLELVKHREDAFVVDSADDVLAALRELRADPALVARLRAGGAVQAARFAPEAVLTSWEELLTGPLTALPVVGPSVAARAGRVAARLLVDASRGDRRSPVWREQG